MHTGCAAGDGSRAQGCRPRSLVSSARLHAQGGPAGGVEGLLRANPVQILHTETLLGSCGPRSLAGEPIGWRDLRDMFDRGAKLVEDVTQARAAYITQVRSGGCLLLRGAAPQGKSVGAHGCQLARKPRPARCNRRSRAPPGWVDPPCAAACSTGLAGALA